MAAPYPPPAGPPGGQPAYPPQGNNAYPPQQPPMQGGQPGYPPPQQPGYPPAQQPGYPPPQQPGYPPGQQAGYPPPQQQLPPMGGPPPGMDGPALDPWRPGQGTPHLWDNLPTAPQPENTAAPSAPPPPAAYMHQYQGYGNVGGFGQSVPLPPPQPPAAPAGEAPDMQFDKGGELSEEQCKEALLSHVAEQCCWGKAAARDHHIQSVQPSNALHYTLETFTEGRSTGYVHEPYRGGPVDGPQCGLPPGAWDMPVQPDQLLHTHSKQLEVPHTASVQMCHNCQARGFERCYRCHGMGHNRCSHCHGRGRTEKTDAEGNHHMHTCTFCDGDGRRRCHTCGGDGRVTCQTCDGYRNLKCFIQLTVAFTNQLEDHIMEKTDMPDHLVRNAGGITIFEQTLPMVWPITAFHVSEINANSVRLVDRHRTAWPNERILQQRQRLRSVAVTEVAYKWKDEEARYWVYGQEHKVFISDYPQTCCWGCNIL